MTSQLVKRRRGRPSSTSADEIVERALEVLVSEGEAALTMRRLAVACALTPMALYRYVRDKDELLDRIVDRVLSAIDLEVNGPWQAQVTELFRRGRRAFLQYPPVAKICIERPTPVAGVARLYARILHALRDAGGFDPQAAVVGVDALLMFLFGAVLWELPRRPTERERLLEHGVLAEHARDLGTRDPDLYFESGLATILDGLNARRA
jgi:AcrR family transcriptional regulator